ncbi:MAG: polyprenyl synthetase family protein [Microscillaceae bacterium]|nr:polyprenyl synthetase family protein [Microscillaceae bacterium]
MNLEKLKELVNQEIQSLVYGTDPQEIYEPIRYIMDLGGKRMRPILALLGTYLFGEDYQKSMKPAIGVEVFHNFTLMHDDIMDNAPLRRGKPTVHEKWNPNVAILSGDVMLVYAYQLMLEVDDTQVKEVIQAFNQCAALVCEGQQLDMNYETAAQVSEEAYIEMIRRKTAVLLGFALELGGIIAKTHAKNRIFLRNFGENIGLGFQLKDDLLDVYGDADKFGKQVGGDIIANKKTFLLIKALENAKDDSKEKLNYWLSLQEFDKFEKVKAVTEIYNQLGIKALTEEKMNLYFQKGFEQLEAVQADEARKEILRNFTEQIIHREK